MNIDSKPSAVKNHFPNEMIYSTLKCIKKKNIITAIEAMKELVCRKETSASNQVFNYVQLIFACLIFKSTFAKDIHFYF